MTEVILTSKQDLQELIKEVITGGSKEQVTTPILNEEAFLTKREASELLKVSTNTVDNYRRKNLIKSYKIGNNVRFKKTELIEAVEGKFSNRKTVTK